MTHESLPVAHVSMDTATGKERPVPRDVPTLPSAEQIHATEIEKRTFLHHLALETQTAYYLAETEEHRQLVHDKLRSNIKVFYGGTAMQQDELFFALLTVVDTQAEQQANAIRKERTVLAEQALSSLEILPATNTTAEPATLVMPVTPEDDLERAFAAPATDFDTPISMTLSEIWQHPYATAKSRVKRSLARVGIIRSTE